MLKKWNHQQQETSWGRFVENLVSRFVFSYELYGKNVSSIPNSWYCDRLLESMSKPSKLPNLATEKKPLDAFILGSTDNQNFDGYEEMNVRFKLRRKMYSFPSAQADCEGYMYHNDQTMQIPSSSRGALPVCQLGTMRASHSALHKVRRILLPSACKQKC